MLAGHRTRRAAAGEDGFGLEVATGYRMGFEKPNREKRNGRDGIDRLRRPPQLVAEAAVDGICVVLMPVQCQGLELEMGNVKTTGVGSLGEEVWPVIQLEWLFLKHNGTP